MNCFSRLAFAGLWIGVSCAGVSADYRKGQTLIQIYGGGAGLNGHYAQPFVDDDERKYAGGGGVLGGQFLYFTSDNPCWAFGFDISGADFEAHRSVRLLSNRLTESDAANITGLLVARLSYPKGHFRPYIQGGLGAQSTQVTLQGTPVTSTFWSDTGTAEQRTLVDERHVGPALGGSIGMHIFFTEKLFVGAEYKVVGLFGKDYQPTEAGRREGLLNSQGIQSAASIGLMLGLGF